jgi:hypothetical protein
MFRQATLSFHPAIAVNDRILINLTKPNPRFAIKFSRGFSEAIAEEKIAL